MASQDSRELVIHRIIWIRKRIRSKQHVGRYKQSVDCRPIITNTDFLPFISNSNRTEKPSFFFLWCDKPYSFGNFTWSDASDEFFLSVIVIQKLRFNRS